MSFADAPHLRTAIESYVDPYLGESLGAARAIQSVTPYADGCTVHLRFGFPVGGYGPPLTEDLNRHLAAAGLRTRIAVELEAQIEAHAVQRNLQPLAEVKNIIAVASGKGGVGKSTVAANLALAWAVQGARVGVLDADIYGPSQPIMLGLVGQRPRLVENKRIRPLESHGVRAMSVGFLID